MKYIQLDRCHAVQIALQNIERNEVAAHVDHQSAPGKPRFVLNRNCRYGKAIGSGLYQLQKCLQPVHDSERRHCIELRSRGADLKRIRFVLAEFRYSFACAFAMNDQLGLSCIRHLHVQRRHARLASKAIQESFDGMLQLQIRVAADSDRKGRIHHELASLHLHAGRHRHEIQLPRLSCGGRHKYRTQHQNGKNNAHEVFSCDCYVEGAE